MYSKSSKHLTRTALALAISAVSLELHAQALEEVVVTAQHREENLQDVPIAITAIGAEDIRSADISDLTAIALRTPGFSMGVFNPAQPQLFIRGVGSNADGAGEDQSVVVFLDGVYLGRTAGQAFDLFDLERLEVLRGPQGTLYGKNAAGGAINIITQKPTEELTGALELSGGDMGYLGIRGKVSGPLGEETYGKISVSHKERDGYVESLVADIDDLNAYESDGIRGQLLTRPADALELLFSADYSEDSRNSPGRNPGTELALGDFVAASGLNPDFYQNLQSTEPHADIETWGVSLQADWLVEMGTFTSITAYRESSADVLDVVWPADIEYFQLASADNFFDEEAEQFSQEFRFAADAGEQLFWQAGVYYLKEEVARNEYNDIYCGLLCGVPAESAIHLPLAGAEQTNETNSYGIFGQGTWTFNEYWDLTLGARYTYEEKEVTNVGSADGAFSVLEPYDIEEEESWGAFTPKVAVNYYLGENLTTYATISTGFKSGGFQGLAPTEAAASTSFDEEHVTNYELGIKGTVLDNSLRFSAVAFYIDYSDLQVLVQTIQPGGLPGPLLTENAGEAQSQGIELEALWQLHDYWQLSGNYAYLDTEYTKLEGNLKPNEGNSLRNAPENAVSLSLVFDYPLQSNYINARVDYTYKDDAYQDIQNRPESTLESYELVNLRLAYGAGDGQWEIAGWVKNAADEEYMLHNYTMNPGLSQNITPAAPRTVGATLTWNY
tara:strand:+ start:8942 stop:11122 length:2181 start_codon:yes stop_codon:yes gene_type:complete